MLKNNTQGRSRQEGPGMGKPAVNGSQRQPSAHWEAGLIERLPAWLILICTTCSDHWLLLQVCCQEQTRASLSWHYCLVSMLHKSEALRALRAACRREGYAEETALELVRYLQAKRYHDNIINRSDRPRNMSPSSKIDRLWHTMLLNTDISTKVHKLVGGVVRHVATDEDDLCDSDKMMQRLYSMNVMASLGWKPAVELWQVGLHVLHIEGCFPGMWALVSYTIATCSRSGNHRLLGNGGGTAPVVTNIC